MHAVLRVSCVVSIFKLSSVCQGSQELVVDLLGVVRLIIDAVC